uniref:Uncharacterized protein n=1 Tax=Aegilops tauschii subsp. strangulata TaxID=200361 RepID=A0A453JPR2_AEGTS
SIPTCFCPPFSCSLCRICSPMGVRATPPCTSGDASASTWPPRAVATLPSADPYPVLYTRRFPARPPVNLLRFSLMQPPSESAAACARC